MCLIIDANKLAETFSKTPSGVVKPILEWLFKKNGCLVYGGEKINAEIEKVGEAKRSLHQLARAGRARKCADGLIDAEHGRVAALGICRSDDEHVVALARISGARVLYSGDKELHHDFKNKLLVDNPRGRIYQASKHSRILVHTSACRPYIRFK